MRPVVAWCGTFLVIGGFWQGNELMLVTGILLMAIDYSADRVIAAISKRGKYE